MRPGASNGLGSCRASPRDVQEGGPRNGRDGIGREPNVGLHPRPEIARPWLVAGPDAVSWREGRPCYSRPDDALRAAPGGPRGRAGGARCRRSEEHTSELQSLRHLVCRLLLEKKKY